MSEEHLTADEQSLLDQMRADDGKDLPLPAPITPNAAEPAASPPPETADDTEPAQPQPQRTVPLAALHEERERRKRAEQDRDAERERQRLLEERTNILLQRIGQQQAAPEQQRAPAPAQPAIPDLATDPVGHILATQRAQQQKLDEFSGATKQQTDELNQKFLQQQELAALAQHAQALEQQFSVDNPDYPQAVQHLVKVRHQELEAIGFRNPGERHRIIQNEGLGVAARMLQQGGNPAEAIYALAKMRGYAAPAQAASGPAQTETPQGSAAVEQRLQNVAAGQQQARSLGNVRGSGPAPLTAQRLLQMTEAEFAKTIGTPEGKALLGA